MYCTKSLDFQMKRNTNSILVVVVLVGLAFFADGYLDSLAGERSAQSRAFDDSGEFLRGVYLEGFRVCPGQDRALSTVQAGTRGWVADVDEVHLEPGKGC